MIDFPSSPDNGDEYLSWTYNATAGAWEVTSPTASPGGGTTLTSYATQIATLSDYPAALANTTASYTTTIDSRLANTSGTNTGDQTYTTLTGGEANYVPLDITPTSIPTTEGTLSWNVDDHTINIQTDIAGTVLQAGMENVMRVRNVSGATITNGSVVYISGASGQRPTIAKAIATNDAHVLSTIGVATSDIAHNDFGYVTTHGLVREVATTGITEGSPIYLSSATAGAFTATAPTTNKIRVGWVSIEGVSGTILVSIEKQSFKSADISDADIDGTPNVLAKRDSYGGSLFGFGAGFGSGYYIRTGGQTYPLSGAHQDLTWDISTANVSAARSWLMPNASGTYALTSSTTGVPDALHNATISGTVAFGTGGQTAMRNAIAPETITENGATRTLALTDAGNFIRCTTACAVTVPQYSSVAFPTGTVIAILRVAGAITLVKTGVTINGDTALANVPVGGSFALRNYGTDLWDFI